MGDPSSEAEHQVWNSPEGLTTLCFADERGDGSRSFLEPGSTLIHTFLASSHYEAMTIYYQFMDRGVYTTIFEQDKEPYAKWVRPTSHNDEV